MRLFLHPAIDRQIQDSNGYNQNREREEGGREGGEEGRERGREGSGVRERGREGGK